jgi:DNA adenine methylase
MNTQNQIIVEGKLELYDEGWDEEISLKGAKVVASNSDPKNADENDDFFDDLYKGFEIRRISANRMINSNAKKRGAVKELLISNIAGIF